MKKQGQNILTSQFYFYYCDFSKVLSLIICTDNRKESFVLGSVGAGNIFGYPCKEITELNVYRLTVYRLFNIQ